MLHRFRAIPKTNKLYYKCINCDLKVNKYEFERFKQYECLEFNNKHIHSIYSGTIAIEPTLRITIPILHIRRLKCNISIDKLFQDNKQFNEGNISCLLFNKKVRLLLWRTGNNCFGILHNSINSTIHERIMSFYYDKKNVTINTFNYPGYIDDGY